ncbi:UDP-N-acetylmuramoyl-L-alanyl-D-glutamate--2,6-diaminopimelate ligase [Marinobacteraceae bacterium S3BR75-40.1]
MCNKALGQLLSGIVHVPSVLDVTVHGLSADSRRVRSGDVFVALAGSHGDPRRFVPQALEAGASAVLLESEQAGPIEEEHGALVIPVPGLPRLQGLIADRFYESPSKKLQVVGVTGTNGKSSVTHFLAQLLNAAGVRTATLGTLGYGFPESLVPASHTTPDVIRVHQNLKQLADQGARAVVMEVSSHALDQGRVDNVRFEGAVFTNLSHDHLDYHGSMEAYGATKARLFIDMAPRFGVINLDDPFGRQLALQVSQEMEVLRYSLHESEIEIWAQKVAFAEEGFRAEVQTLKGPVKLEAPLLGAFNVSNLLATVGAAIALGIDLEGVSQAVKTLSSPAGRLQRFAGEGTAQFVVDYAHTPDALDSVLQALRPHVTGRLWCIFGCGGDRDAAKRPVMGRVAEQRADQVVVTDDNPRSEDPATIVRDILQGLEAPQKVQVIHDRRRAIEQVGARAGAGDIVLVAGKGHEDYQERNGERTPFSDIEVVRSLLRSRGGAA